MTVLSKKNPKPKPEVGEPSLSANGDGSVRSHSQVGITFTGYLIFNLRLHVFYFFHPKHFFYANNWYFYKHLSIEI